MDNASRKDMERERKILLTRKKVEGFLAPEDEERLAWLELEMLQRPHFTPGEIPDLSEESSGPRSTDDMETMIGAAAPSPPASRSARRSRRRTPRPVLRPPDPPRPLSASELFTDSVIAESPERTTTGARPIDMAALEERERRQLTPNHLKGPRRVIVHLSGGLSKHGVITEPDPDIDPVQLEPGGQGDDPPQQLPAGRLETIRCMLPKGIAPPELRGRRVQVTLRDGKALAGFTPDHTPDRVAFTLFPTEERYIERIIVYQRAVRDVDFLDE